MKVTITQDDNKVFLVYETKGEKECSVKRVFIEYEDGNITEIKEDDGLLLQSCGNRFTKNLIDA